MSDGSQREIGIERLHMEQDAGKLMHDQDPNRSFIDLNRSGIALMEIVTKPDIRSAEEAGLFLHFLRMSVQVPPFPLFEGDAFRVSEQTEPAHYRYLLQSRLFAQEILSRPGCDQDMTRLYLGSP